MAREQTSPRLRPSRAGAEEELPDTTRGGAPPSSNLVFVRTRQAKDLDARFSELVEECWPFHEAVIRELDVKVVLCFGHRCGKAVRERLGAHSLVDEFVEQNDRGWKSYAHATPDGAMSVLTLTHPTRAACETPAADPTPLVRKALGWR